MPVIGMTPIAMPVLMAIWEKRTATIPTGTSRP